MKSNIVQDAEDLLTALSLLHTQTNSVMGKVKESSPESIESRIYVSSVIMKLTKDTNYLRAIENLLGKKLIEKPSDGSLNQDT